LDPDSQQELEAILVEKGHIKMEDDRVIPRVEN
jgi:hypothetical protein